MSNRALRRIWSFIIRCAALCIPTDSIDVSEAADSSAYLFFLHAIISSSLCYSEYIGEATTVIGKPASRTVAGVVLSYRPSSHPTTKKTHNLKGRRCFVVQKTSNPTAGTPWRRNPSTRIVAKVVSRLGPPLPRTGILCRRPVNEVCSEIAASLPGHYNSKTC